MPRWISQSRTAELALSIFRQLLAQDGSLSSALSAASADAPVAAAGPPASKALPAKKP